MFTGISGSNTVEIASMIAGFNAAVFSASAVNRRLVVDSGAAGVRSRNHGRGFMSLSRDALLAFERRLERVPRQAGALHAHRKLAHAGEHRQLSRVLDRLIRRRRDHV